MELDEEKKIKNREYCKKHYKKMMNDPDSRKKMMEANRVGARAYYHKHKHDPIFIEKCRIIDKRYRAKNKESIREKQLIYRANNNEQININNRALYAKKKADGTLDINKKREDLRNWRAKNRESAKISSIKNTQKVRGMKKREIERGVPKKFSSRLPRKNGLDILRQDVKVISCKKPKLINRFAVHRSEIIMRLKARKAFNEGIDPEKKMCDNLE